MPVVPLSARGKSRLLLATIVVIAAALRFADLGNAPPGLQQDEACNAWNAWCLLNTGKDQAGASWPILYAQALGENRSTLFFYWTIPFQLLAGLNVWSTRAPAAFAGVLTVVLLYYVGSRLFDRRIGLFAAAFLALCPWHVQHTRWGHESSLGPLAVAAALALAIAAGFPLTGALGRSRRTTDADTNTEADAPPDSRRTGKGERKNPVAVALPTQPITQPPPESHPRPTRPLVAALAGLITAAFCYGYPSIRLYVPALMLAILALTLSSWREFIRTRRGVIALAAYVGVGMAAFMPLLWEHIAHPAEISRRAEHWVWNAEDGPIARVGSVAQRYIAHFGPDFLYLHGDGYEPVSSPTGAYLPWYSIPLLLIGAIVLALRMPRSTAARVALAALVLYPIGDALVAGRTGHALRSMPGVCAFALVAAVGAVTLWQWLRAWTPRAALGGAGLLAVVAVTEHGNHLFRLFGEFNRRTSVYHNYQVDLLDACAWLRPRMGDVDTVVMTPLNLNCPYIITLVALQADPATWQREGGRFETEGIWNRCIAYGKFIFAYPGAGRAMVKDAWEKRGSGKFYTIARPGELPPGQVDFVVRDSKGQPQLEVQRRSGAMAHATR